MSLGRGGKKGNDCLVTTMEEEGREKVSSERVRRELQHVQLLAEESKRGGKK